MKYRSVLFVPGHEEKKIKKAYTLNSDLIVLDLESTVPENQKDQAKKIIKECIARGKDFYFMDTGYIGNNPSTTNPNGKKIYHRIVKNALQNLHMPELTFSLVKQRLPVVMRKNHQ